MTSYPYPGCCKTPPPFDCVHCNDGETPQTIRIVTSGFVDDACTGAAAPLNGTFDISQSGPFNACLYSAYRLDGAIFRDTFSCLTNSWTWLQVIMTSTTITLNMYVYKTWPFHERYTFEDLTFSGGDCCDELTPARTLTFAESATWEDPSAVDPSSASATVECIA